MLGKRKDNGANVGVGRGQESEKGGPAEGHYVELRASWLN